MSQNTRIKETIRRNSTLFGPIYIAGIKDPGKTGNLEVRVVGGKLLHSKIGGAGFVDTEEKMTKIVEGVEEALAAN